MEYILDRGGQQICQRNETNEMGLKKEKLNGE